MIKRICFLTCLLTLLLLLSKATLCESGAAAPVAESWTAAKFRILADNTVKFGDRIERKPLVTNLTVTEKSLLMNDRFSPIESCAKLPKSIKKGFCWIVHINDLENEVSDPGGPFQAGCVGNGPMRRLVHAYLSEHYCFVISEHGGFAHSSSLLLYRKSSDGVVLLFGSPNAFGINTLDEAKNVAITGRKDTTLWGY